MKTSLNPAGAVSRLYIANANRSDSGNYTCSLGDTAKTTIAVHVLNGRWPLGSSRALASAQDSPFIYDLMTHKFHSSLSLPSRTG